MAPPNIVWINLFPNSSLALYFIEINYHNVSTSKCSPLPYRAWQQRVNIIVDRADGYFDSLTHDPLCSPQPQVTNVAHQLPRALTGCPIQTGKTSSLLT